MIVSAILPILKAQKIILVLPAGHNVLSVVKNILVQVSLINFIF